MWGSRKKLERYGRAMALGGIYFEWGGVPMDKGVWNTVGMFVAIITSIFSLFYANQANHIARKSNDIAKQANKDANRPILNLTGFYFDPQNAYVFGGKNVFWDGKKKFIAGQLNELRRTHMSYSLVRLGTQEGQKKEEYFLVNLCDEDTPGEDIGLILNALTLKLENVGTPINELTINETYSMLSSKESFPTNMHIGKSTFLMNDNRFTIKIAYACPLNKPASLNLTSIAKQITAEEKEEIDLLEIPERAGEILGFIETAYQFSCKTVYGIDYDFSFFIDRDMKNDGRLEQHHLYYTRDVFNRRSEKASSRAGKNVVIVKSNEQARN